MRRAQREQPHPINRLYVPEIVAEISSSAVPLPASLNRCFSGPGPEDVSTKGGAALPHITGLPNLHHQQHSGARRESPVQYSGGPVSTSCM